MKIDIKESFQSFLLDFRFFIDLCDRVDFRINSYWYISDDDWYSNKNFSFEITYHIVEAPVFLLVLANRVCGPNMFSVAFNRELENEFEELSKKGICKNIWYDAYEFTDMDVFFGYIKKLVSKNSQYDFDMQIEINVENIEAFCKRMEDSKIVPEALKEFLRKRQFDEETIECGSDKIFKAYKSCKGTLKFDFKSNNNCHLPW